MFEDGKVFVGKHEDDTGSLSANIIGCRLHTDASDSGYAITLNAGDLMVIDNTIEGYGRGITMNVASGSGSIVVANNQVSGLTHEKKPVAFQISQDAGGRSPVFQGNTVGEGCIGLSIYFDFDTTGSVVLMYNKFTDCVADILYSFDGQEDNQQYDTPITLVDNNITHGGTEGVVYASEISETDGKEYGDVPSDDQATVDDSVTEASSCYTPGQNFTISDEDDLRQFAMLVNSGIDFDDLTVTLAGSIDLDGAWTPIGTGIVTEAGITGTPFRGTFVGNGNTISGITIGDVGLDTVGLFGYVDGAAISNVVVVVEINTDALLVGGIAGIATNGSVISGCNVSGIISSNATETAGVGGIVGTILYNATEKEMAVTYCDNYASVTGTKYVGGIAGISSANITNCNNKGSIANSDTGTMANDIYNNSVGGIVGEQRHYGTVSGCHNYDAVTNNGKDGGDWGTGGIVGWVRYMNAGESALNGTVSIVECKNLGAVSSVGTSMVGGIVGCAYHSIVVDDCFNNAKVTGGVEFVAGIIGGMQTTNIQHAEGGCRLILTDNINNGTVEYTGSTSTYGSIIGHHVSKDSSSKYNCAITHGSYWTVIGNVDNRGNNMGTGLEEIQTVATVTTSDDPDTTYGYPTLQDAIDNAVDRATVTLISDVTESVSITSGISITLDLGGNTLSIGQAGSANTGMIISGGSDVTMKNGTVIVEGSGNMFGIQVSKGDLTIDCTIDGRGTYSSNSGMNIIGIIGSTDDVADYSSLELKENGTIKYTNKHNVTEGAYAITVTVLGDVAAQSNGVKVDLFGTITGYMQTSVYVDGLITSSGQNRSQINIHYGAKLTGNIYGAGVADYVISGKVDGSDSSVGVGAEIRGGTVTVKEGAEIIGGNRTYTHAPLGNGFTTSNVALAVSPHTYLQSSMMFTVNGGTFSGTMSIVYIDTVTSGMRPSLEDSVINDGRFQGGVEFANGLRPIEGGIYDQDVTEYCAPGLMASKDASGNFVIGDAPTLEVTVSYSPIAPSEGQAVTVAVTVSNVPEGTEITYIWNGDSETVTDTTKTYTAPYGKTEKQTLNVSFTAYGNPYSESWERSFFGDHTVTVTFPDASGMADQQFIVRDGEAFVVSPSEITSVPDGILVTGFDYMGQPVTSDITIEAICALVSPTVSYTIDYHDGYTLVSVTYGHVLGDSVMFAMAMSDSDDQGFGPDGNTFTIRDGGTYTLAVACALVSDESITGSYSVEIPIEVESDPGIMDPPFIPGGDDDDVYIPPTIVVDQGSSDDDDAVKIAACAAAAVAAAIIALILVAEYRKR